MHSDCKGVDIFGLGDWIFWQAFAYSLHAESFITSMKTQATCAKNVYITVPPWEIRVKHFDPQRLLIKDEASSQVNIDNIH